MEQRINKKMTLLISSIIAILVLVIGITFAYFAATGSADSQRITSGELSIKFTTGNILRTTGLIPIQASEVETKATEINFSVENTGDLKAYFDVYLSDIVIAEELKDSYFKYRLYEGETVIGEGNFELVGTDKLLQRSVSIESGVTKNYKVLVWLEESNEDQNAMQNKSLTAKVTVKSKDRLSKLALGEEAVLTNTVANGTLSNFKLYGNSVQEGTPTPTTPIEIQSVGNLVTDENDSNYGKYEIPVSVTGKNLFDYNNPNLYVLYGVTVENIENGFKYTSTVNNAYGSNASYSLDFSQIAGKIITVSGDFNLSDGNTGILRIGYWDTNNVFQYLKIKSINTNGKTEVTAEIPETLPDDAKSSYCVFINVTAKANMSGATLEMKNLQVEVGNTSTEYESYKELTHSYFTIEG